MAKENGNRTIGEMSDYSKFLVLRLRDAEIGETVTYDEMSASIHRNTQHEARGNLDTARRRVMEDDGIVFGAVLNVGIKRLNDEEIVSTGTHDVQKIHRISKRAGRRLDNVKEFDGLGMDKQKELLLLSAGFGVLEHFGKASIQKKLIEGSDPKKLMPTTEMLKRIEETLG